MLSAATRKHELIVLGISPRGSLALCKMAKASAYMAGRDYVTPEDVRYCVGDVFRHRLVLKSRVRLTAQNVEKIINDIFQSCASESGYCIMVRCFCPFQKIHKVYVPFACSLNIS